MRRGTRGCKSFVRIPVIEDIDDDGERIGGANAGSFVGVEELEHARPHHGHHASVVAVHFEVLEGEAVLPHVTRQDATPFERWCGACPLGHQDRQPLDPIERIRGDSQSVKRFVGEDCGLCKDTLWSLQRWQFPETRGSR